MVLLYFVLILLSILALPFVVQRHREIKVTRELIAANRTFADSTERVLNSNRNPVVVTLYRRNLLPKKVLWKQ